VCRRLFDCGINVAAKKLEVPVSSCLLQCVMVVCLMVLLR